MLPRPPSLCLPLAVGPAPWAGARAGASPPQGPQGALSFPSARAVLRLPLLCCVSASARRGLGTSHPRGCGSPNSRALGGKEAGAAGGAEQLLGVEEWGLPRRSHSPRLGQGAQRGGQHRPRPQLRVRGGLVGGGRDVGQRG